MSSVETMIDNTNKMNLNYWCVGLILVPGNRCVVLCHPVTNDGPVQMRVISRLRKRNNVCELMTIVNSM